MAVAEGIQRAIQLYSVLNQQQMQTMALERRRRRDTLEEQIQWEDLKLRKRKDATAELKERQAELAKLDEEGASELEPGEQPVTDIGEFQVPQSGGGYGTLPGGVGQMSVPVPSSRIVEVQGGGRYLRRPVEERLKREVARRRALNTVVLPGFGDGGGETAGQGSGEGSGGGGQAQVEIEKEAIPFATGELSRRAAEGRQKNQQAATAEQGRLNREGRTAEGTLNRTSREKVAATRESGADKRAAMRGQGRPAAKPTAQDRQTADAQLVEKLAQRAIDDNEAGGGAKRDAVRNAQKYYEKDPDFPRLRTQIIKRILQKLSLGPEALKPMTDLDRKLQTVIDKVESGETRTQTVGKDAGQGGGAARVYKKGDRASNKATGQTVEFDGTKWVPVN